MINVSIIGSGNVAAHLVAAFDKSDSVSLKQLFSRSKEVGFAIPENVEQIHDLEELAEADLYIIAVTDSTIETISAALPFKNRLVAHTSGTMPLDAIHENNRKAVFYPLQTFSKSKAVDFGEVPVCLESQFAADYQLLERIGRAISDKVYAINSDQRKAIHVAAVFANNFTNHMYQIANEICSENQVPFDILKPLIAETAAKINTLSPGDAQTGPAKRHDFKTVAAHLAFLSDEKRSIYKLLTESIQQHGKEL
ncbi:MAG: hypothetical protein CFE23_11355 [Flavobacterium sp. BFFFF1]|uniref:Rossmann-like and DUF2520 domain-containing protein n=1 Tax=Flavobacterium sp. BFFFF1 TaxID=2015557 RepID=UPI000BC40DDC|nr:Rossmann-like and DUF2520 domain-containing protein [Flavobacterium sp. BFFFF1]OYU79979.1 MAG: hypothetical protein CFE23_11355 [Flavobacterium sp. BFFFF1]